MPTQSWASVAWRAGAGLEAGLCQPHFPDLHAGQLAACLLVQLIPNHACTHENAAFVGASDRIRLAR